MYNDQSYDRLTICDITSIFTFCTELYTKQMELKVVEEPIMTNNDRTIINDNWCNNVDMVNGKMPSWNCMRSLQDDLNAWCYLNFYFLPLVVGKCWWVSSIQRRSKLRSIGTPSDRVDSAVIILIV